MDRAALGVVTALVAGGDADGAARAAADELVNETTAYLAAQLRQRFAAAKEAQKHSSDSVTAGREYVARYVEFTHYVEQLHGIGTEGAHAESSSQR